MLEPDDFYLEDGLMVFTEQFHRKRGSCCGNGCRHCPYDHVAVPSPATALSANAPQARAVNAACPSCGTEFHCGVRDASCWCRELLVSAAARGKIGTSAREGACLCGACLA